YFKQKDYERAEDYFTKSLVIAKNISDKWRMASQFNNLGNLYIESDYKKAYELFNKANQLNQESSNKYGQALCSRKIADILVLMNRTNDAKKYYSTSLEIGRDLNHKIMIMNALEGLGELSEQTGNYKDAYKYLKEFYAINDSIEKDNAQKQLLQERLQRNIERKEEKIEKVKISLHELEKENGMLVQKNEILRKSLLLLCALVSILGLFFYYLYKKKR
ncbi:MAG: hypothetical protein MI922_06130, partial [Bacteroidales bacterium]|nr:hypothetical protein [Bacteroidales bacterium]